MLPGSPLHSRGCLDKVPGKKMRRRHADESEWPENIALNMFTKRPEIERGSAVEDLCLHRTEENEC